MTSRTLDPSDISDIDVQRIWKEMESMRSVNARRFVLALIDFYSGDFERLFGRESGTTRELKDHVQQVQDVISDDGTGLVSVEEVETFCGSRPHGWTLPQWIAYWAFGWQHGLSGYKHKIYSMLTSMYDASMHCILPANKGAVNAYLYYGAFRKIELMLRSTTSKMPETGLFDRVFENAMNKYEYDEENRIRVNLERVAYELAVPSTVSWVMGTDKTERDLFRLIYLLLQHHQKIIAAACVHVLDPAEFDVLSAGLESVFSTVDERVQDLKGIFKQMNVDSDDRFRSFAFGMFRLLATESDRNVKESSIRYWENKEVDGLDFIKGSISAGSQQTTASEVQLSVLRYGLQATFYPLDYTAFEVEQPTGHPIQGSWTGYMTDGETESYAFRISLRVSEDDRTVDGVGETYKAKYTFRGKISSAPGTPVEFLLGVKEYPDLMLLLFSRFDSHENVISAAWSNKHQREDPTLAPSPPMQLRRVFPSLLRFRYTHQQFIKDPSRSRWSFACKAAMYLAQVRYLSPQFLLERVRERRRFVELNTRDVLVEMDYTPQNPLSPAETTELDNLKQALNPSDSRYYKALSTLQFRNQINFLGFYCDYCGRNIIKARHICLQCVSDDFTETVDICLSCVRSRSRKQVEDFLHEASHDLIRITDFMHDPFTFGAIVSARDRADKYRNYFSRLVRRAEGAADDGDVGLNNTSICGCCEEPITIPFWSCINCSGNDEASFRFYCLDCCLQERHSGLPSAHSWNHWLILVSEGAETLQTSTGKRLEEMQKEIVDLKRRISVLESKVQVQEV